MAQWIAFLFLDSAAPGLNQLFSRKKLFNVVELIDRITLLRVRVDSPSSLPVNQTHPVAG